MINTVPRKLVIYNRDGLIEQEHFGFVVFINRQNHVTKLGEDNGYPFYLRSCAKPLQASLMVDYNLIEEFNLTEEEIAICMASHAGENIHVKTVRNLLNKFGISEKYLKCGEHEPISKTAQNKLLLENKKATAIHNNCSGKHSMMLGLCKLNNWNLENYDNINHPLQVAIKNKIYELCELNKEYPITKDGCGVPIHSMPLKNIVKGYLNLFCNDKYQRLANAFINNPYIAGGENRTDTLIMENSKDIIAKVGAGGLCTVVNLNTKEGFVVKICDSDMVAREHVVVDMLRKLNWADIKIENNILTNHKDVVGKIVMVQTHIRLK